MPTYERTELLDLRRAEREAGALLEAVRVLMPEHQSLIFKLESATSDREGAHIAYCVARLSRMFPHLADVIQWACIEDTIRWPDDDDDGLPDDDLSDEPVPV